MNQFIFTGNTTQDLKLSKNNKGHFYTKATLAVNDYDFSKKEEVTYFFDVLISGKTTPKIVELCGKGSKLLIQGSITKNETSNTNNNGETEKKYYINFIASKVEFLSLKKPSTVSTSEVSETKNSENIMSNDHNKKEESNSYDEQISNFTFPLDSDVPL